MGHGVHYVHGYGRGSGREMSKVAEVVDKAPKTTRKPPRKTPRPTRRTRHGRPPFGRPRTLTSGGQRAPPRKMPFGWKRTSWTSSWPRDERLGGDSMNPVDLAWEMGNNKAVVSPDIHQFELTPSWLMVLSNTNASTRCLAQPSLSHLH